MRQPGAFVKSIVAKVLYKTNAIYLQLVYLGAKLYRLGFLASYNGAYIGFAQAYNPVFYLRYMAKNFTVLLLVHCSNGKY